MVIGRLAGSCDARIDRQNTTVLTDHAFHEHESGIVGQFSRTGGCFSRIIVIFHITAIDILYRHIEVRDCGTVLVIQGHAYLLSVIGCRPHGHGTGHMILTGVSNSAGIPRVFLLGSVCIDHLQRITEGVHNLEVIVVGAVGIQ